MSSSWVQFCKIFFAFSNKLVYLFIASWNKKGCLIVLTYFFLILKSAGLHSDKKCTSVPTFFTEDRTKLSIEESMYHTFVYKKLRIWVSTGSFLKSSDLCSPPEHFKTLLMFFPSNMTQETSDTKGKHAEPFKFFGDLMV